LGISGPNSLRATKPLICGKNQRENAEMGLTLRCFKISPETQAAGMCAFSFIWLQVCTSTHPWSDEGCPNKDHYANLDPLPLRVALVVWQCGGSRGAGNVDVID